MILLGLCPFSYGTRPSGAFRWPARPCVQERVHRDRSDMCRRFPRQVAVSFGPARRMESDRDRETPGLGPWGSVSFAELVARSWHSRLQSAMRDQHAPAQQAR